LGQVLRVLSANLWNGGADPVAFAELVESLEVDVVATQELSPEQADALADVLPHGELAPARDYTGMGLAMRRPGKLSRVPLACRDAWVAELHTDSWPELGTAIEVVNVHIAAPTIRLRSLQGLRYRRVQVPQLERYLERTAKGPRVLVGDFNSTPLWPAYHRFASRLSDVAVAVAQRHSRPLRRTWGPWAGSPRLLRIDHGFVEGLHAEDFRVVHVPGSDHSAVVMDLAPTPT